MDFTVYKIQLFVYFIFSVCQVNSILRHVGELLNYDCDEQLEELYQKSAWFFDRKYGKPGSSYEAFKLAVTYVVVSYVMNRQFNIYLIIALCCLYLRHVL